MSAPSAEIKENIAHIREISPADQNHLNSSDYCNDYTYTHCPLKSS